MDTKSYFNNISDKIIEEINNAEISLFVVVAWITDKKILDALIKKKAEGIELFILINKDDFNDKMSNDILILKLENNIRKIEHHHKFCIIDYCTVITGSYNWTNNASTKKNQENIIVSKDSSVLMKDYLKIFYKLLEDSSSEFKKLNYKSVEKIGLIERIELPELQVDGVGKRYYKLGDCIIFMDERVNKFENNQEIELILYNLNDTSSVLIASLSNLAFYNSLPLDFYCNVFVSKAYGKSFLK